MSSSSNSFDSEAEEINDDMNTNAKFIKFSMIFILVFFIH